MRRTRTRTARTLAVGAVAALALSLGSAPVAADPVAAGPGGSSGPRGDQPLPGYTVVNPPLAPLAVDGATTRVEQGTRAHAGYVIEVPPEWNGELVMWAHGYRGTGSELTVDPPGYGLRRTFVEQGYAWAASSYARNDYDVATGVTTTRDLARYAGRVLGRSPERTYLAGVSMGGHVIGRSLEEYPAAYDGALPMCGVLGDQELFDYLLDYNLVAQTLADREVYPAPADYLTDDVPVIQQRLGIAGLTPGRPLTNELGRQLRAVTTERSGGPRPGSDPAFAVWKDFLFTLYTADDGGRLARNAGRLATNVGTDYAPDSPVDLDALVRRVAPTDPASRRSDRLTEIPRIDGEPRVPVLTLHGLGDLFVPFSMEQVYAREVAAAGRSGLLVQRAVRAAGHCEFTPGEAGAAWDDLTDWVESRRGRGHGVGGGRSYADRPAGDDVLTRATVAAPGYGCRFTDPTGYASPQQFPTRALYPRCPAG